MVVGIVLLLIVIDQWSKIYVKTHFEMHESYEIFSWFKLVFIENNGMAFGMEFGAKLFLTLFRIVASGALIWYIVKCIKKGVSAGYLVVVSAILAGALGNIIDCMFYGLIFDNPAEGYAQFVSFGDGYGRFLEGRVVDMFYFPLFEFNWPDWVPFVGGDHFLFFNAIFNFADSCITCGVFAFLIFYRSVLQGKDKDKKTADVQEIDKDKDNLNKDKDNVNR